MEVVNRYLGRLRSRGDASLHVSIVSVTIPSESTSAASLNVAAFLDRLVRADDLVFWADPHRCILVLAAAPDDLQRFCARAAAEFTSESQPDAQSEPLKLLIRCEGSWRVNDSPTGPKGQFAALMDRSGKMADSTA